MNVYDFDGTLYAGDSTVDFILFLLRRHPATLSRLPAAAAAWIAVTRGKKTLTAFKETAYRIFSDVPDVLSEAELFWKKKARKLKKWYRSRAREGDLVISASPEFVVAPACERLGIRRVMASRVDPATGRFDGVNCRGEEKIRRFREIFPDERVEDFYSDSHNDDPMARIASRAFFVKGEKIAPWRFR
ncbi:MAG: HAD-IB family phosphatase [Clostridia bacterium]|nr:HAD-IB family phosphatase [Clostridia bacterium]